MDNQIASLLRIIEDQQRQNDELREKLASVMRSSGSASPREVWAWFKGRSLKQRACALAYAQGVPVDDIAKLIDASESTVRLHLRACRTGLGDGAGTQAVTSAVHNLLATTSSEDFRADFGIEKAWYKAPSDDLLSELRIKTSSLS